MKCRILFLICSVLFFSSVYTQKIYLTNKFPTQLFQGKNVELEANIINQNNFEISGTLNLALTNAITKLNVDGWFMNVFPFQYYTVAPNDTFKIKFPLQIPMNFYNLIKCTFSSNSNSITDSTKTNTTFIEKVIKIK